MAKIQIALDCQSTEEALDILEIVGGHVDIIEVGTILCLQEGKYAIDAIRKAYPKDVLMVDTKCADAGFTVASNAKDAGADQMTVMCNASIETMIQAKKALDDIQIELYGDWTFIQAQSWLNAGLNHVIYHQSRDALIAGKAWTQSDIDKISKFIEMGFRVSVTGGLDAKSVSQFKGLDVDTFIFGRSLTQVENPIMTLTQIRENLGGV